MRPYADARKLNISRSRARRSSSFRTRGKEFTMVLRPLLIVHCSIPKSLKRPRASAIKGRQSLSRATPLASGGAPQRSRYERHPNPQVASFLFLLFGNISLCVPHINIYPDGGIPPLYSYSAHRGMLRRGAAAGSSARFPRGFGSRTWQSWAYGQLTIRMNSLTVIRVVHFLSSA